MRAHHNKKVSGDNKTRQLDMSLAAEDPQSIIIIPPDIRLATCRLVAKEIRFREGNLKWLPVDIVGFCPNLALLDAVSTAYYTTTQAPRIVLANAL